jgi:hypothetical protein
MDRGAASFSTNDPAVLHDLGGCAILPSCRQPGIRGADKYQEILTLPKAKIVDINEIPGSPVFY